MTGNIIKKAVPIIAALVLFAGVKAYAAGNPSYFYDGTWHEYTQGPVSLHVNGQTVTTDMPPILFNDSTLVPARAVFEKMGAKVTWDEANKKVVVNLNNDNIEINIDSTAAKVNGDSKSMPIPAKIINDRTMIPVRFVSEALGNSVLWDDAKRLVSVETPISIKSITSGILNDKLRITVSLDKPVIDVKNFTLENKDRIVLDFTNTKIYPAAQVINVPDNGIVTGIRAAQSTVNPYVTRVVADLNSKTGYTVTMSDDKKTVYLDMNIGGTSIGAPQVDYGTDSIAVKLPANVAGQPYLYSAGKGVFYLDIPKSKFGSLPAAIQPTNSTLVNKIEFEQADDTARLKVYADKPVLAKVLNENGTITLKLMNPALSKVEYSMSTGVPKISIKSELTSFNHYRYDFRNEGSTFVLRSYSNLGSIPDSKLFINDGNINAVVFLKYESYGMEYYVEPAYKMDFKVDSVSEANTISLEAYIPKTNLGQNVPITDSMKKKLVIIDPGHGGKDPGAVVKNSVGATVYEKDLNLDISLKLYYMLKNAGFNAQLTRSDDTFVELYDIAAFANNQNASLFVSVHNNYLPNGGSGTMNFFYPSMAQSRYGISSERVAQIAKEETSSILGSVDLGIWKRPRLAVLNGIDMPGILSEIGVMNDMTELNKLQDPAYRNQAAQALFNVIKRALYEMENSTVTAAPKPAVSRGGVDATKPVVANGFTIPALATAKAAYNWKDAGNNYYFDLSIMLDYSKEVNKTATLEEQRKEAVSVLSTKLDSATIGTITEAINRQTDYSSHIYEEEIETADYYIWVRSIKTTGICSIDIRKK